MRWPQFPARWTGDEAILEHGGEATASKNAFLALSTPNQADLIAFLNSLVLFQAGRGLSGVLGRSNRPRARLLTPAAVPSAG
jgi:hypothetical protein